MSSVLSAAGPTDRAGDPVGERPTVHLAPWAGVGLALASIVALGLADYYSPRTMSMSAFYLLPIVAVTVAAGRRAGLVTAMACVITSLTANNILPAHGGSAWLAVWNSLTKVVIFSVVVELVDRGRRQAAAARAAERRSRDFLASAAHQLRTPLAGVRSTVDTLLLDGDLSAHQEQMLIAVSREASRAGRHLASLLRVARLDQHEPMPLRRLPADLLLEEELERAAARRPGLRWALEEGDDALEITCNPDSIGEAVANLLDNAGRHARSRVGARVRADGEHVEIVVRDDGPGIPGDSIETAFHRFVSLDQHGGSGLGLPIARGIAEAHEGSLEYRDGEFVLRLPVL